jgi:putative hydrolase of the HAD superfamily
MQKEAIETVVFDIGMVLLKFDFDIILKRLSGRCTVPASEMHHHFWGSGLVEDYDRGKIDSGEFAYKLCQALGFNGTAQELLHAWSDIFSTNDPMVERLHKWKKQSIPIYFLSNTCAAHVEFFTNQFNFFELFDGGIYSYQEGVIKPEPTIYRLLIQRYQLNPSSTLFIDDRRENIEGARNSGMHSIHYEDYASFEKKLEGYEICAAPPKAER